MAIEKSWRLTEKAKLINDFEKLQMIKPGFSKAHSNLRIKLNMILCTKEAIFSSYQVDCAKKDVQDKF